MRYSVKNMGDGWFGVVDTKTNRVAEYRRGEREAQEVADRMNATAAPCAQQAEQHRGEQ